MTDSFRPTVLRAKAREALRGKWSQAAVAGLVILVILGGTVGFSMTIPWAGSLFALLVYSVIALGAYFMFLDVCKGAPVELKTLIEPLHDYGRYLLGYILVVIYTLLWALLLYIPGIIKAYSYSMTFLIMRENPGMSGEDAIRQSMAMMKGHKMDLFLLSLSFIGWILLGFITAGIALLWVYPYMYTAVGAFYEELKKDYEARQAFTAQPVA